MVDVVGEWEVVGLGLWVDDAESFEVAEVFAVGCTEFDEVGRLVWSGIEGFRFGGFGGGGGGGGREAQTLKLKQHYLAGNIASRLWIAERYLEW